MELTIRDWMVVIGAGIILAVLVDAARRVYRERRTEVRLNARINRREEGEDDDDAFNLLSELPNGGARIVRRDDLAPPIDDIPPPEFVHPEPPVDALSPAAVDISDLEDPNESPVSDDRAEAEELAPLSFSALDDDELFDAPPVDVVNDDTTTEITVAAVEPAVKSAPETLDWLEQLAEPEPEEEPEARLPRGIDPHVFVLNVISRSDDGFAGRDIMHILLACDLRFGDMDFFHRHEQSAGRGPIQFSVCNMMKPGVFDIDQMDSLRTRGLMFFVTLPGPEDMLKAFDYMYETAKTVAKNLNGDVLDETRSAVTRQSLEHMRQQIRELERRVAMEQRR